MNDENLIPMSKRTPRERSELGKKGNKASTEAKRRKKSMREMVNALLDMKVTSIEDLEELKKFGDTEKTHKAKVLVALIQNAEKGNIKATEVLLGLAGESVKPVESEEEQENLVDQLKDIQIKIVDGSIKEEK